MSNYSLKPLVASLTHPFKTYPILSFLGFLVALVALIVLGDHLRKPVTSETVVVPEPKKVEVYEVGGTPSIQVQARIEKSGVIKLVAQTSGVIQKIKVSESDHVKRGTSLFVLSTNYQGGNAAATSRQIAQKSYAFATETYDAQLQVINRSRDIARKAETQASELRTIGRQSFDETKSSISLNEEIISGLDKQIKSLEASNVGGTNDAAILQFKQAKSQSLAGLNGLRAGLRNAEYFNSEDQEPAQLAVATRENTLQQLDLQEKTLTLNKDISQLSLRIAQITESLMYPGSPCPGTVERIHVKVGQVVQPGTLLATIRGDENEATAVVLVTQDQARVVSMLEPSVALIGEQKSSMMPRSVSQEPTDGALHSVLYSIPEELSSLVSNESYVQISIPVGMKEYAKASNYYVPLDSIYQGQNVSLVNVVQSQNSGLPRAKSRSITLGSVTGQYVEVVSGLQHGDKIILNRSVVDGEAITHDQK